MMDERKIYISTKLNKWSDLDLNDLFSRLHLPLNKIGKSIGFCLIYDKIDDALDSDENIENLIEIKIKNFDKSNI